MQRDQKLLEDLRSDEWSESAAAALALGARGQETVPSLAAIATNAHEASEVRRRAIATLGKIGGSAAITAVGSVVHDEDSLVRFTAASALGEASTEHAIPPLLDALQDEDPAVERAAHDAVIRLGELVVLPLISLLTSQESQGRRSVIQALGSLRDTRAVMPLLETLRDPDVSVRWAAAEALGDLGDQRAVDHLVALLSDQDADVRGAAVAALGQLGDARALTPLEWVQQHDRGLTWDHVAITDLASEAIEAIHTVSNAVPHPNN